jgi:hypothetical protein
MKKNYAANVLHRNDAKYCPQQDHSIKKNHLDGTLFLKFGIGHLTIAPRLGFRKQTGLFAAKIDRCLKSVSGRSAVKKHPGGRHHYSNDTLLRRF